MHFSKDSKYVLKGVGGEGVFQDISDLCRFMEECLDEWLNHINTMRTESYYLNHFTTEQLVILQNELAKVNSPQKDVSPRVYPLLSGVKRNCSLRDLEKAMHSAFQDLAEGDKKKLTPKNTNKDLAALAENLGVQVNDLTAEQSEEFSTCLEKLKESDFSEKLAKLAIDAVGCNEEEGNCI